MPYNLLQLGGILLKYYQFQIHCTTIGRFVPLLCKTVYNCLKEKYLKIPSTEKELNSLTDVTFDCWQFPNTIGAADGKHNSLFHSNSNGSEYNNYKGFFSLVILALFNYNYKFIFIDIGSRGRINHRGICNNSSRSNAIEQNYLNLPAPGPLAIPEDPAWYMTMKPNVSHLWLLPAMRSD